MSDISKTKLHSVERKKLFTDLRENLTVHTIGEIDALYETSNDHSKLDLIDMVQAYRKVVGIVDSVVELDYENDGDFDFIRDTLLTRIESEERIMKLM